MYQIHPDGKIDTSPWVIGGSGCILRADSTGFYKMEFELNEILNFPFHPISIQFNSISICKNELSLHAGDNYEYVIIPYAGCQNTTA